MSFGKVQRRVRNEFVKLGSIALSRALGAARNFSSLPLVVFAHGVYDESADRRQFPTRNFISSRELAAEMDWLLSRGYRFVGFQDLIRYLKDAGTVPARSVHVMFDDGYRSVYDHAFPVLAKRGVPFSVALVERFVKHGELLWYDDLDCRVRQNPQRIPDINRVAPEDLQIEVFDPLSRQVIYRVNRLKVVADTTRRDILERISGFCPFDDSLVSEYLRPLTTLQIGEMRRKAVTFLSHSRSHPILSTIASGDVLRDEVTNWDPEVLEGSSFVLPDGKASESIPSVAKALRDAGIQYAFSTVRGLVDRRSSTFALNRISLQRNLGNLRDVLRTVELEHMRSLKRRPGSVVASS